MRCSRATKMTGASEITLEINPGNAGVLLRRKLDYQFPNQPSEVAVAPVIAGKVDEFRPAGVWYLAGSNTCLFSNASHELAASQHVVQTSNRRFRDDEFLLSRALTAGHTKIRVRVTCTPVEIPLMPGRPLPELAWSEIRYDGYCVMPPGVEDFAPSGTARDRPVPPSRQTRSNPSSHVLRLQLELLSASS